MSNAQMFTSAKKERPPYLPEELDKKLRAFITHMRMTNGGTINCHVIFGVFMGLIKRNLVNYDMYLEFQITYGWIQSFYRGMNLSGLMMTTARPTLPD